MQIPIQISFHQLDHSDAVEAEIKKRVQHLEKYFSRITSMRVTVHKVAHRRHQGDLFEVKIDLTLPGAEIVAGQSRDDAQPHENIGIAIRDAFDVARRRLEDYVRIHFRGRKKGVTRRNRTVQQ